MRVSKYCAKKLLLVPRKSKILVAYFLLSITVYWSDELALNYFIAIAGTLITCIRITKNNYFLIFIFHNEKSNNAINVLNIIPFIDFKFLSLFHFDFLNNVRTCTHQHLCYTCILVIMLGTGVISIFTLSMCEIQRNDPLQHCAISVILTGC